MLLKEEVSFIENKLNFDLKQRAVEKIKEAMSLIKQECDMVSLNQKFLGAENNFKLTKGENYYGYPYVVMDYPCFFSKEKIVVCRFLCWFGHGFFSSLLLLDSKEVMEKAVLKMDALQMIEENVYLGVNNLWDYRDSEHLTINNKQHLFETIIKNGFVRMQIQTPLSQLSNEATFLLQIRRFIKLAKQII